MSTPEASPEPLTIGIDARAAVEVPAGRGRVVRELLRALAARAPDGHRYVLYARERWHEGDLDDRFTWRTIAARDPWWHLRAALAANGECDVFLSSNSYLTVSLLRIPAVAIVHDLLAFDPAMRANRRSAIVERLTLGPAARRAAGFVAVSRTTAHALAARHPGTASRTVVAHLGAVTPVASLTSEEEAKLPPGGFVLAVGTLEPRKNLPRLVQAYCTLEEDLRRGHPLVVVGALGWKTGETLAALRSLGTRCLPLGYVSDAALAELYRRCAVFCYPSLGEGFGLPVLEAMAAGAAVLTSNVSSLPEVGGEAVVYADPLSVPSIATQLRSLLTDEARRKRLSGQARARAREFSWSGFAEIVLEALQRASTRS
ncbi:MAG TPA: glycosyltransferase family 1 protein [Solirubrobacteraceae bacterium]|nr:glycosyltransferase family 1 protein [Solirubrobacteraceae bacterium]